MRGQELYGILAGFLFLYLKYQPQMRSESNDAILSSVFFIDYDGVYVRIEMLSISTEEMMSIIDSIG